MKTKKLLCFLIIVFHLGLSDVFSQQQPTTGGGDITGSNGSIAYSVGQPFVAINSGTSGSLSEGVQQPYEISEVLSTENFLELSSTISIYPNPTSEILTLKIEDLSNLKLQYQLYEFTGKIVQENEINGNNTSINVANLQSAIYFLKILNSENGEFKTYKIIKN